MKPSEKKILAKIRKCISYSFGPKYMFWFIYDGNGTAIDWEGGYDLPLNVQFRNQYTIEKNKKIVKNWE
jgi:hypothetical protein